LKSVKLNFSVFSGNTVTALSATEPLWLLLETVELRLVRAADSHFHVS
jgi:hypothetical protein